MNSIKYNKMQNNKESNNISNNNNILSKELMKELGIVNSYLFITLSKLDRYEGASKGKERQIRFQ